MTGNFWRSVRSHSTGKAFYLALSWIHSIHEAGEVRILFKSSSWRLSDSWRWRRTKLWVTEERETRKEKEIIGGESSGKAFCKRQHQLGLGCPQVFVEYHVSGHEVL